jgi:hypothetical protein
MMENDKSLQIRVTEDLRDAFIEACKSNDTTAAQELRRFMRDYVKKHGQRSLL